VAVRWVPTKMGSLLSGVAPSVRQVAAEIYGVDGKKTSDSGGVLFHIDEKHRSSYAMGQLEGCAPRNGTEPS